MKKVDADKDSEAEVAMPTGKSRGHGRFNPLVVNEYWGSISIVLMIAGVLLALSAWGGSRENNGLLSNRSLGLSVLFSIVSIIILATAILFIRVLHNFMSKGQWLGGLSDLPKTQNCKFCTLTIFAYGLLVSGCSFFIGYFVAANFLLLISGKVFYIFKGLL